MAVRVQTKSADPRKAILVNSHFDSALGGLGATDAGALCAVMMEVIRNIYNAKTFDWNYPIVSFIVTEMVCFYDSTIARSFFSMELRRRSWWAHMVLLRHILGRKMYSWSSTWTAQVCDTYYVFNVLLFLTLKLQAQDQQPSSNKIRTESLRHTQRLLPTLTAPVLLLIYSKQRNFLEVWT